MASTTEFLDGILGCSLAEVPLLHISTMFKEKLRLKLHLMRFLLYYVTYQDQDNFTACFRQTCNSVLDLGLSLQWLQSPIAIACPIPLPPPVTSAVLPSRLKISNIIKCLLLGNACTSNSSPLSAVSYIQFPRFYTQGFLLEAIVVTAK